MGSALLVGDWYLYVLCLCISVMGQFELYRIFKMESTPLGILGYSATCLYYICMRTMPGEDWMVLLLITAALMCAMVMYVCTFPKYKADQVMCCVFGMLYVAVMLSYIYKTRTLADGIYIVWLIFVASWVSDTFAYLTGVAFGKHKMTPKLSPKKSVEGAVGGVASSMIVGAVYGMLVSGHMQMTTVHPAITFAVAALAGSLLSIIGDLAASAIKRNYDIKDYGTLIPGHGGILDRFDSVIFTAPVVYWAVYLIAMF